MKFITLLVATHLLAAALAGASDVKWLPSAPKQAQAEDEEELDQSLILEVVHSKVAVALGMVKKKPAIALSPGRAEYLTGRPCKAQPGLQFVLIRAQFGQGGTGSYLVSSTKNGKRVYVAHVALGSTIPPTDSILVVQLRAVPRQVYTSHTSAL